MTHARTPAAVSLLRDLNALIRVALTLHRIFSRRR